MWAPACFNAEITLFSIDSPSHFVFVVCSFVHQTSWLLCLSGRNSDCLSVCSECKAVHESQNKVQKKVIIHSINSLKNLNSTMHSFSAFTVHSTQGGAQCRVVLTAAWCGGAKTSKCTLCHESIRQQAAGTVWCVIEFGNNVC